MAAAQIVVDDDLIASLDQHLRHMAADIAGAARHQYFHVAALPFRQLIIARPPQG